MTFEPVLTSRYAEMRLTLLHVSLIDKDTSSL
jgi:hypothetical protein